MGVGGEGGAQEEKRWLTSNNEGLGWLSIGAEVFITGPIGDYGSCTSTFFFFSVCHLGHLLASHSPVRFALVSDLSCRSLYLVGIHWPPPPLLSPPHQPRVAQL